MHAGGALTDTGEHVGGNIGKLDWCMHFLSSRADSTMLLRARAVHPLWYKIWIGSEARMIPFFVQIKCQLGKAYDVAGKLADAEIASEIYSTAGDFDLLVKFYVEPSTDIGHFIAERVQTIPGIADTRTIITFKAFGAS
jgi:DNA-binding Lrp family transcriptional regulator